MDPLPPLFFLNYEKFLSDCAGRTSRGKQQHSCKGLQEFILGFLLTPIFISEMAKTY